MACFPALKVAALLPLAMPVRDLVGHYETRSSASQSHPQSAISAKRTGKQPQRNDTLPVDGLPPPSVSSASYTRIGYTYPPSELSSDLDTLYDATSDTHDTHDEPTKDIVDELDELPKSRSHKLASLMKTHGSAIDEDAFEMKKLLPRRDTQDTLKGILEAEPTLELDSEPSLPSHNPIPATTVFARNAAPLSFPELDAHLAAIPPPAFHTQASKDGKATMFPPLQLLAASKKTLEDLEDNNQIPSWYANRNKISGALASLALSITVGLSRYAVFSCCLNTDMQGSSALVSLYSLRGLIDMLQIFALILNTIGKWRR